MHTKGNTLQQAQGPLGSWYAEPLTLVEARRILDATETRLARRYRQGGNTTGTRLRRMTAHFWLGESIIEEFALIQAMNRHTTHGRALGELIYGQLLLSRRLADAWQHLDRGFVEARPLFAPADYFLVLNRHQVLRDLPVGEIPAPAAGLDELITVARVAARLTGRKQHRPIAADSNDTFG